MKSIKGKRVAAAAMAAVAATAFGLHAWASADATSVTPPPASSGMKISNSVPASVIDTLAKDGVTIGSPAAAAAPVVSGTAAAEIGRNNFGLDPDATAATATLATVTVRDMGKNLQTDPSKPSQIVPTINNRTVWVINFPSVQVPAFGPLGNTGPETSQAGMVAFIDPVTGAFLLGQTY